MVQFRSTGWLGLVWCQVADERLSTWFYAIGLALQLGAKCWASVRIVHSDCLASYVECLQD